MPRKTKEKPPLKFTWNLKGVVYDEPPDWFRKHLGNVFTKVLFGRE